MKAPTIEVTGKDPDSLARSTSVKVNGNSLRTPELALEVPVRNPVGLEVLSQKEFLLRSPLMEVYRTLSIDRINECVGPSDASAEASRRLSSEVGASLRKAAERGGVPILILALTDNNRNPLNAVPPRKELDYILDLLWRPENKIVVPPVVGTLTKPEQYQTILEGIQAREESIQERFTMAVIPSTYRSITEQLVGMYWKSGARIFAVDLQARGFAANAPAISLVHRILGGLANKSKEAFVLHALNSRERVGVRDSARTNWLTGAAFGFDTVGANHIPPRGFSSTSDPVEEVAKVSLFQSRDFGYYSLAELRKRKGSRLDVELDTFPFDSMTLDTLIKSAEPDRARTAAKKHNISKALRETKSFQALLEAGRFGRYVHQKDRVMADYEVAREVGSGLKVKTID